MLGINGYNPKYWYTKPGAVYVNSGNQNLPAHDLDFHILCKRMMIAIKCAKSPVERSPVQGASVDSLDRFWYFAGVYTFPKRTCLLCLPYP
ncbi:unnamed protein product [Acanthoscelides obtectus]|uniref:Uncharacterized protein n=1 Tax=Acanthoscelides obtectus TaxID=200917 RepID=A0A9P0L0Y5_ACAOB|nr:unnamed protein product [Acanthoscelides obtectus]CAK1674950.1 hypothetical protein AOBTE_LOCUS29829 [Acanthoscelides obtectus]